MTTPENNGAVRAQTKKRGNTTRMSKADRDRRTAAALDFFAKNHEASVAKLNAAFQDGSLTGRKEPTMNVKKGYQLRHQARKLAAQAELPPNIPASEFRASKRIEAGAEAVALPVPFGEPERGAVETLLRKLQSMPEQFADLVLHRDGKVTAGRLERRETPIALSSVPA